MCYVPDPYDMWEEHEAAQEKELEELPICEICHEHIQQEKAIHYNDLWCCEECEQEFWQAIRDDFLEGVM